MPLHSEEFRVHLEESRFDADIIARDLTPGVHAVHLLLSTDD
jgi:hypothetical protein